MDDARAVGLVERVRDLDADPERLLLRQGALLQPVGERLAFEVLHHQVVDAVLLADVVEGADVGMVEGGGGAGLTLEARAAVGVLGEVRGQDLDGDGAVQARVARAVDLAHPARAKGREDLVGTEARSGRERHSAASLTGQTQDS